MKKIFCFGNEFVKQDSLAKEVVDELKIQGVEFVKCSSVDGLLNEKGDLVILDVVKGINEVITFNDLNRLKNKKICSLHDFDVAFFLKLMKELKQINKIIIIGIPQQGDKEKIKSQLRDLLPI